MVKEGGFHERLKEIHQIVVAADVGDFVSEKGVDVVGGEADDGGSGKENDRAQHAESGGDVDSI